MFETKVRSFPVVLKGCPKRPFPTPSAFLHPSNFPNPTSSFFPNICFIIAFYIRFCSSSIRFINSSKLSEFTTMGLPLWQEPPKEEENGQGFVINASTLCSTRLQIQADNFKEPARRATPSAFVPLPTFRLQPLISKPTIVYHGSGHLVIRSQSLLPQHGPIIQRLSNVFWGVFQLGIRTGNFPRVGVRADNSRYKLALLPRHAQSARPSRNPVDHNLRRLIVRALTELLKELSRIGTHTGNFLEMALGDASENTRYRLIISKDRPDPNEPARLHQPGDGPQDLPNSSAVNDINDETPSDIETEVDTSSTGTPDTGDEEGSELSGWRNTL